MERYTELCEDLLANLYPDEDDYEEKLLEAAKRFRHFDAALDVFLSKYGYDGEPTDNAQKISFIRAAFENASMIPPREIREWYENHQPISRKTAFQICFAFHLDIKRTNDFFRRVYARERSFDCHSVNEAVYYFCIRNGLPYSEALEIIDRVPQAQPGRIQKNSEILYTGSIIKALDQISNKDDLIRYLTENNSQFCYNNVTAYEYISKLWKEITGADGFLDQEQRNLFQRESKKKEKSGQGFKTWDAVLSIFDLDKKSVSELPGDRSLKPILESLSPDIRDAFPDRQGIDMILRGEHVHYERVRKWLILLAFYRFWIRRALETGNYDARYQEEDQCLDELNRFLLDAGYMELYPGNPYDWLFLFAAHDSAPLITFRGIWQTLLADVLD